MFHIKALLSQFLKQKKIQSRIKEVSISKKANQILKQTFNSDIKVCFYKNKTLFIKCPNSILANELRFQEEKIKNKLNDKFNKEVVKNIIIRLI